MYGEWIWGLWITVWYGLVRLLFVMSPLTVTFSSPKLSFKLLTPSVLSSGAHSRRQNKSPTRMAGRHKHQKEITARALNHQPTAERRRKKRKEGSDWGKKKNYIEKSGEENGIKKEQETRKHLSRDALYVVARGLVIEVTKERYEVLKAGTLRQETGIM